MTTTYTDAQFSGLIDDMLSYARMVGYANSAGERENHRRSCDTAKDIVMSAYTYALAERKAAIQPQDHEGRVDYIAKLIADKCGNGMREKYEDVARKIVEAIQPQGGEEWDAMVDRLAKYIFQQESIKCSTLDAAIHHRSQWRRGIPEARAMLKAALPPQYVHGGGDEQENGDGKGN